MKAISIQEAAISEGMRLLAKKRWAKATPEDRAEQGRKMVAGRQKARRARRKK